MPQRVRYLTHPQVHIDPALPVPSWRLSAQGRQRVATLIEAGWLAGTTLVVTSAETKALETAGPISQALGSRLEVREAMHENDRSSTGFLPPAEFERVADAFFARPDESPRGWETARAAQTRIVHEAEAVLARHHAGDVLFVGHGAVGTLLMSHYGRLEISRTHDQQPGGGNYFTLLKDRRRLLHRWRPIELGC
jgi:broad specificity phosphatase PhoE